jgi:hypothetical protein
MGISEDDQEDRRGDDRAFDSDGKIAIEDPGVRHPIRRNMNDDRQKQPQDDGDPHEPSGGVPAEKDLIEPSDPGKRKDRQDREMTLPGLTPGVSLPI